MLTATFYPMFVYVYKILYCLLINLFLCAALPAQIVPHPLDFKIVTWDFGKIREADGSVFHSFPFVNSSSGPVTIGRVSPSCRCVNAIATQESFENGEMGEMTVRFNPAGETGQVHRYVDIYSSEGIFLVKLSITAHVIPEERSVGEQFGFRITDNVYATSNHVNMGYIPLGGSVSKTISVINTSSESVKVIARPRAASSFLSTDHSGSVAPGETLNIEFTYEIPDDPDSYGIKKDTVDILADGVRTPFAVNISCICTDHFRDRGSVVPDLTVSPSLVLLKRKLLTRNFEGHSVIANRGSADLHIRAVETDAGIQTNINKGDVIRPGERMRIKAGSLKKAFSVFLITNDPVRPVKEIRFNYKDN